MPRWIDGLMSRCTELLIGVPPHRNLEPLSELDSDTANFVLIAGTEPSALGEIGSW